jgi:4-hydroxybenzoyl-CoA thioesterase
MKFTREIIVRFEHCDAAGLMFYPRFFALVNEMVEDWFAVLGADFKTMHIDQRKGVPTVKLDAEFGRPARMGDRLTQTLHVEQIGAASCKLVHEASVDGATVAQFQHTIVFVDLDGMTPESWPNPLRKAMTAYQEHA